MISDKIFVNTFLLYDHKKIPPPSRKRISSLFLGALAMFRKATISFVMSVCLSVRPPFRIEELSSQCTDIHEI